MEYLDLRSGLGVSIDSLEQIQLDNLGGTAIDNIRVDVQAPSPLNVLASARWPFSWFPVGIIDNEGRVCYLFE